MSDAAPAEKPAPWWLRAVFVALGLAGWFGTQEMLGKRDFPDGVIGDGLLNLLAGANRYLHDNPGAADALLIVSSTIINVLAVFLLVQSIFGRTVRPFLGLLMLFGMRQICQMLCALPAPEGMIWRDPGFPGFLVTYGVTTDLFFSGHTALAFLGAVELVRFGGRWWLPVGVLIAVFEALTVLVLRAHYTMDVYTGAIVALFVAILAERWAPRCDAVLARVPGRFR